jgi:hypothetical protein
MLIERIHCRMQEQMFDYTKRAIVILYASHTLFYLQMDYPRRVVYVPALTLTVEWRKILEPICLAVSVRKRNLHRLRDKCVFPQPKIHSK